VNSFLSVKVKGEKEGKMRHSRVREKREKKLRGFDLALFTHHFKRATDSSNHHSVPFTIQRALLLRSQYTPNSTFKVSSFCFPQPLQFKR